MRRFLSRFLNLAPPSARRPRSKRSALQVEFLERRETPAALDGGIFAGHGGVLDPGPDPNPAAITFTDGVITAIGTQSADVIRIDPYVPVASQDFIVGTVGVRREGVRVRVMDTAGVPRRDASGTLLDQIFGSNEVEQVNVEALGGDDQVINATSTKMAVQGGEGNDTLTGGPGKDQLQGDGGNDRLVGGAGSDALYGGTGDDTLYGEAGDDFLLGMEEADFVYGGAGNDVLLGGTGADHLFGEADNDVLHGNEDNDVLLGGTGNDNLYGGAGADDLQGEQGNDGLFGGEGRDVLKGGPGIDRFLRWNRSGNSTTLTDRAKNESLTTFKGTTTQQVTKRDGPDLRYNPREWTEGAIAEVDTGLAFLHAEVGNTKLLKLKNGRDLTIVRVGSYIPYNVLDGVNDVAEDKANKSGSLIAAWNRNNGEIFFVQVDLTNTIHELAHNWDTNNPRYKQWLTLSGWVKTNKPKTGQVLSLDKKWVYNESASFARDYGKTNPSEDFATMFEEYYNFKINRPTVNPEYLISKLNFIGLFITSLA